MQLQYILAIVCGGLFIVLMIANIITYSQSVKKAKIQRQTLEKMYADKNLNEMKYDFAIIDEETEDLLSGTEDIYLQAAAASTDEDPAVFGQLSIEGLEEITGDYKPE